jgi:DNA repair exonuclease SbcCD nuclease subunit
MANVLIAADLHLTDNPLEQYRHDFVGETFMDLIEKHKADAVVLLGDLTEEKDRHSAKLVNRIVGYLSEAAKCCPVALLMGNHDYANEGQAFFEFTRRIRNIRWIGKPTSSDDMGDEWAGIFSHKPALFLPHTRDYQKDWASIMNQFKGYDVAFAHNTFEGADTGFKKLEGIPLSVFPKSLLVIAGDIHVPQTLGMLMYCGAPYTVDFGDAYDSRVLLYDTEQGASKFIDTSKIPQKRLVVLEGSVGKSSPKVKANKGDLLKVRINVDDMANWPAIVSNARRWAEACGFNAVRIEPILAHKAIKRRTVIETTGTDSELIKGFAKRHNLTKAQLDAGLDLL